MATETELNDPWLVAVWPGMGSVALLAGTYLLQQLNPRRIAELNPREFFDIERVEVKNGIATLPHLPRGMFFEWKNPRGGHDLLIFIGEAQPAGEGFQMCQRIIELAAGRGAKHCFTFASMATQLQLGTQPRVFAVATDPPSLEQVQRLGVEVHEEGQISGLNGVLLAAGAERGLHGTCLLGELPYFALGVPNPRAALVVLQRFTELAEIDIDFTPLEQQAVLVEQKLEQLLQQMRESAQGAAEETSASEKDEEEEMTQAESQPAKPSLDPRTQRRIEALFEKAQQDRSKAFELKYELDRLGAFKQYEDRFLDLFRKAE